MAISGTYAYYAPDIASIFAEAFERAGIAASSPGNDHIESAFRSLYLICNSEWQTLGFRTWMFQLLNFTTTPGYGPPGTGGSIVPLPAQVLTVSDAILRRDGRDTPINVMSRNEYLEIPDKTQQGRPDRYFVERLSVATSPLSAVNMYLWRAPENDTDQIFYWAFCVMSDPGDDMSYSLDVRPEMLEALHAGLAARLALKFNIQRYELLQSYYRGGDPNPRNIGGVLAMALDANRDFGDVRFSIYPTQETPMSRLTTERRKELPEEEFALPSTRSESGGKGGYPIQDRSHARSALQRVSQFGTQSEKATVRRKVEEKYPGMVQKK